MKTSISALGGWLWALLAPVAPCAALCSLLVLVETLSAYARNRRLLRDPGWRLSAPSAPPPAPGGQLSAPAVEPLSRLLAGAVSTLTRVNIALIVAAMMRVAVLDGGDFLTVDIIRLTAGVISVWQIVTILENESVAVPSARRKFLLTLRRWIIKKAKTAAT